jgi:hypothetical protein
MMSMTVTEPRRRAVKHINTISKATEQTERQGRHTLMFVVDVNGFIWFRFRDEALIREVEHRDRRERRKGRKEPPRGRNETVESYQTKPLS